MPEKKGMAPSGPRNRDKLFSPKRSEALIKSLRDQSAFVETMLGAVQEWVIIADASLRIVRVNAAVARELEAEEPVFLHRQLETLFTSLDPPDSFELARAECLHPRVARSFSTLIPDLRFRRKFTIRPLLDEVGRYGYLLTGGFPAEFSECDEDADAATMYFARRILEGLELPALLVELGSQVIVDCNERFSLLFDRERRDCLHSSSRILFADEADFLHYRSAIDYGFKRTGIHMVERPFFSRTGKAVICRLTVLPVFMPRALEKYAICLFEDRSAERRREEYIADLVAELEKAAAGLVGAYRRRERDAGRPGSLGAFGASRRQIEIGRLLLAGSSTKEISLELGLAESTVKNHLVALYKKLGVSTRVDFTRAIVERGILPL